MAWYGFQLAVLLARGPHMSRYDWVGWKGGWEARKSVAEIRKRELGEDTVTEPAAAQEYADGKGVDVKAPEDSQVQEGMRDASKEV